MLMLRADASADLYADVIAESNNGCRDPVAHGPYWTSISQKYLLPRELESLPNFLMVAILWKKSEN